MSNDFWVSLKKMFSVKNRCGYIFGNFWKKLGYFLFQHLVTPACLGISPFVLVPIHTLKALSLCKNSAYRVQSKLLSQLKRIIEFCTYYI